MNREWIVFIELLLVFVAVIGFGIWQLVEVHRDEKKARNDD